MKKDIHPKYHTDSKVTCACGSSFATGSILKEITIEICSACHPFFTGEEKILDTGGRVGRFKRRQEKIQTAKAPLKTTASVSSKTTTKKTKKTAKTPVKIETVSKK